MLRILLCDDDARMLDKIHSKVRETMDALGEKVSISKYTNADMIGTAALAAADLALLDVDLEKKDYNGVDLARRLRAAQPDCVIVFITNYLDYAPEGYEVQAFRYVLKRKLDEDLGPVLTGAVEQVYRHQKMIQIQLYGEIVSVPVEKVLYLEVHQHRITIRMTGAKRDTPSTPPSMIWSRSWPRLASCASIKATWSICATCGSCNAGKRSWTTARCFGSARKATRTPSKNI